MEERYGGGGLYMLYNMQDELKPDRKVRQGLAQRGRIRILQAL